MSKEDEERYQKLLSENEDLQRLIAQVCNFFLIEITIHIDFLFYFIERGKNQIIKR